MSTYINQETLRRLRIPRPGLDESEDNVRALGDEGRIMPRGVFSPADEEMNIPRRVVEPAPLPEAAPVRIPSRIGASPEIDSAIAPPTDRILPFSRNAAAVEASDLNYSPAPSRNQINIGEGLRSADPREIEAAMELRRNEDANKPRGFWGKVGRVLKGVGEGAIEGAARGGGIGMLTGAVAGGVSPRFAQKMHDESEFARIYPRNVAGEGIEYRNRAQDAQIENQRQIRIHQQQAQESLDLHRQALEAQAEQAANDRRLREKQTDAEQAANLTRLRNEAASKQQESMGKEGAVRMPELGRFWRDPKARAEASVNQGVMVRNVDPSQPGYRLPSQAQTDSRKLQQVTAESRARNAAEFEQYLKKRPFEMAEFENKERIKASFDDTKDKVDLAGVPTLGQFESAKSKAQELATRSSNARKAGDAATADKLQAQADAALGEASAYHSAMVKSGAYQDNSSGGWPGLTRNARTKKGGVGGSAKASSSGRSSGTPKDMSQEVFEHSVKTKFGGDVEKAKAEAKRLGYTIGGQAIQ